MSKNNTDQRYMEKHLRKTRVLVAPLDWGLGHATRCVPIIRELLAAGTDVWLAGEGLQKQLLQQEFPKLPFLDLAGYRVKYAKSATGLLLGIFRQTSKILRAIRSENNWLKQVVKEHSFDLVISDNRYGLYHVSVPCIFITHQLKIKSPLGKWTEKILQKRNYRYINRFTACWVPDAENNDNLAGELSHPEKKPLVPVHYIGPLSRLKPAAITTKKDHLLIVLSGPEPQRTMLENTIIKEIVHYPATATIVRGLPGDVAIVPSTNMIQFYNHLPADELANKILEAEYVIGRCGYSTVMDMVKLQKKSILLPTPGQTEQEYLASYLFQKKIAFTVKQEKFSLTNALQGARNFDYRFPPAIATQVLEKTIATTIASLSQKK